MRRLTAWTTVAAMPLLAGMLTAVPATALSATADAPDLALVPPASVVPKLDWRACADSEGLECATAEVPTTYRAPKGRTTSIALVRIPAAKPAERIGSLFTNPGGPGGSGVDFIKAAGDVAFSQEVRDHYDIIGFDPRAVGASDQATCYASAEEESAALANLPAFPLTKADGRAYLPLSAAIARACKTTAGERISHSSTANVARDMDLLRRAVGDQKLHYVGYSYGTFLGATYAKLFPRTVGPMVLDGTLDPEKYSGRVDGRSTVGVRTGQGPASAETFQQFLATCREAGDRCALNALGDPEEVVDRTFESLRTTPVPIDAGDGTTVDVDYPTAIVLSFQSMYAPAQWAELAELLAYLATGGEGTPPAAAPRALQQMTEEPASGYTSIGGSLASVCVDSPRRSSPQGVQQQADVADRAAPGFGRFRAWVGVECLAERFVDRDAYRGSWRQTTQQEVLVIGTRHDPATPYAATAPYAKKFPRSSVLTVEGYGHTILGKSTCADDIVTRYLVDGVTPGPTATCQQDVAPFAPTSSASMKLQQVPVEPAV